MQNMPSQTPLRQAQRLFQQMRALPEHHRRIFAMSTMMAVTMVLVAIIWSSFIPLQPLRLSSVDSQQIIDNRINTIVSSNPSPVIPPQFANVSGIPEIGPLNSFMDSFKEATKFLVPKELQYDPLGQVTPSSWKQTFSDFVAKFPATFHGIKDIAVLFVQQMHTLFVSFSQLIITFLLELFK